jgi:hypothetical protein
LLSFVTCVAVVAVVVVVVVVPRLLAGDWHAPLMGIFVRVGISCITARHSTCDGDANSLENPEPNWREHERS